MNMLLSMRGTKKVAHLFKNIFRVENVVIFQLILIIIFSDAFLYTLFLLYHRG